MSHHSGDENMLIATSDSFWEPGNYRRTTRRIDDSFRLCTDLVQLLNERSDIEKNYAKNLKCWSKKWNDLIERGPEYGTTEAAWKGMLMEADRLSDIHLKMKDKLTGDLVEQGVIQCKVRKEMEDSFKKVQKPWAKLLAKVNKTKANYHGACKAEKSALNQERNANNDSSLSQDQLKKLQDRVLRAKDDVQKTREKYESALQDLHNYNAKYMDDMSIVFDRCQDLETMRLQFFKEVLFSIHSVLNISQYPELPQIYDEFHRTITNADYEKDLKWWSNNHGVNMAMNWPQFEEYVEEFREITKGKSKESLPVPNILLINQRPVGEDFRDPPPIQTSASGGGMSASSATIAAQTAATNTKTNVTSTSSSTIAGAQTAAAASTASINMSKLLRNTNEMTLNGAGSSGSSKATAPSISTTGNNPQLNKRLSTSSSSNGNATSRHLAHNQNRSSVDSGGGGSRNDTNPFDDESTGGGNGDDDEWEENDDCLVDNGEPGVPVRALYDYEQAENDELSFKQGDVFEKLEDEDEQGWCKGRKDGRVGLYPANYVKEIS